MLYVVHRNWAQACGYRFRFCCNALIRQHLLPPPNDAPRARRRRRRRQSAFGRHDASTASKRFISMLKIDCGAVAFSSSAGDVGSAIAMVAVASSARTTDRNQERTIIANLVK